MQVLCCLFLKVCMISSQSSSDRPLPADSIIWDSLKQAIAASSGFQRWRLERSVDSNPVEGLGLDHLVRRYLRETLETLAY